MLAQSFFQLTKVEILHFQFYLNYFYNKDNKNRKNNKDTAPYFYYFTMFTIVMVKIIQIGSNLREMEGHIFAKTRSKPTKAN